jgi:type I site-specific restriction-modification system R (restriction) subunit
VGSEPRLKQVATDLVAHFEKRNSAVEGKAMVVGMSREICVDLYNQITAIRPEWHNEDPEKGSDQNCYDRIGIRQGQNAASYSSKEGKETS